MRLCFSIIFIVKMFCFIGLWYSLSKDEVCSENDLKILAILFVIAVGAEFTLFLIFCCAFYGFRKATCSLMFSVIKLEDCTISTAMHLFVLNTGFTVRHLISLNNNKWYSAVLIFLIGIDILISLFLGYFLSDALEIAFFMYGAKSIFGCI